MTARLNQKDQPPTTTVIAKPVRAVAIRIPCDAVHRPSPPQGDGKRTDCHVGLCPPRNDVVILGWSF